MLAEFSCKDEEAFFRKFDEWTYGKLQRSVNFKNAQKYADAAFKDKIDKFLTKCKELQVEAEKAAMTRRQALEFPTENGILKQYCGYTTDVTVPDGVTKINDYVFGYAYDNQGYSIQKPTALGNKTVVSVTLPSSVRVIGDYAFNFNDKLKNITLNEGLAIIGNYAFNSCRKLTSLTIPDSVVEIGNNAFALCDNIKDITLPNSLKTIGASAFQLCEKITNITLPNNLKIIGADAFYGCRNLSRITIPNSVTAIGEGAFYNCYLYEVTIPKRFKEQLKNIFGKDKFGIFGPKIKVNFT